MGRRTFTFLLAVLLMPALAAQSKQGSGQQTAAPALQSPDRPPRSDSESSSKDTKVDLAPPPGQEGSAPGTGNDDVRRTRPWNPHRADKNVEVGDYYFRRKNYSAAISRYREALQWQDNDAIAFFRLGQALEAIGQYAEARKNYQEYLKILPEGKLAAHARKALDELRGKPDTPKTGARSAL